MKRLLSLSIAVLLLSSLVWAQTVVSTDAEIRAAVLTDGANIQLGADIDLSNSTLSINEGLTVTIDMNGHKLDRRLTKRGEGGGQVITVRSGATLNLSNGTLTGGWGGAGGALSNENGTVFLTDVIISNNVADDRGGGICNREGGTLTMTGGAITNNRSNDRSGAKGGGGFFNETNATATLTNVTISGNEAKHYGGGGICNFGTLTLNGVTIQDNKAGSLGGAIWEEGTLYMQGANTIIGNKVGNRDDNLYLYKGKLIHVTGSLAGSTIGVGMEYAGTFTEGYSTYMSGVAPSTLFSMDNPIYTIALHNNEGCLGLNYLEHSWDEINKQVITTTKTLYEEIGFNDNPTSEEQYKVLTPDCKDYDSQQHHISITIANLLNLGTKNSPYHEYYVVKDNSSREDALFLMGPHVHIIICDNATMHPYGVSVIQGTNFYLHAQSSGANMGRWHATGEGQDDNPAVIGARDWYNETFTKYGGNINIHGCDIRTTSGNAHYSAIGGGYQGHGNITIWGGKISAKALLSGAGIGGGGENAPDAGTITIYGGEIEAHGEGKAMWGGRGAGIGGGLGAEQVTVHIYGGNIKAYGGVEAAGIGGTQEGNYNGTVIIDGGTVKAYGNTHGAGIGVGDGDDLNGGTITINGGEVYAYGGTDAAGIGGGEGGAGGTITVTGGYVYAEGNDWGAGIGGGQDGKGADVTITGGTVVAKAGRDETGCRAIGPGEGCNDYGKLTIGDNMMVSSERKAAAVERKNMCWYRTQVRIEPCDHSAVTYTVDGTGPNDHHIAHCVYCNHTETDRHTFDANGVCTVCGVHTTAYAAKLYMPVAQPDGSFDGKTYSKTATHLVVPDSVFRLPMATLNIPGLKFVGWEATTEPTGESYQSPYTNYQLADTLYRAGNKYKVTENISFVARYKVADIYLYDDEPNGEILNDYNGMTVAKVILSGRVFNKNNIWQPLTLPFSLSADELAASPLAGCTLKELDTENSYNDAANHMVYLYFKDTTAIEAGKPYIIRWASGNPVLSPEFTNVTLTNKTADAKGKLVLFKSLYSPQTFTSANKKVLYFREDGVLVFPDGQAPVTVGAFRAYFRLTNFQADEDPDAEWNIQTNLDGEQGIDQITNDQLPMTNKVLRNGMLLINRDGKIYTVTGTEVR